MTAVARLMIGNHPILLGDLLISGQEQPGQVAHIPTVMDMHEVFPAGSGMVPVGLDQKVLTIGENLLIGWAGDRLAAKIILRAVWEQNKSDPFTRASLRAFLGTIEADVWSRGLRIAGFVKEPGGYGIFEYGSVNTPRTLIGSERFGNIVLLGTGSADVQRLIDDVTCVQLPTDQVNTVHAAIATSFVISGTLLAVELATRGSLLQYYGASYEVGAFFNGKFQKIDGVTYLFWIVHVSDGKIEIEGSPRQVFAYRYDKDLLLIRSASFRGTDEGATLDNPALHCVTPIYRDISKDEEGRLKRKDTMPSFENRWLCTYFVVVSLGRVTEVLCSVDLAPPGADSRPIRFTETDQDLRIAVSQDFLIRIGRDLHERFTTNRHSASNK